MLGRQSKKARYCLTYQNKLEVDSLSAHLSKYNWYKFGYPNRLDFVTATYIDLYWLAYKNMLDVDGPIKIFLMLGRLSK